MICTNCGREIGQRVDCSFCGYDPTKDAAGVVNLQNGMEFTHPAPITIRLNKKTNGMAIAGFILSFFSSFPLFWLLSVIFSAIGFSKAKSCRSGRVMSILGIIVCSIVAVFYIVFVLALLDEADAFEIIQQGLYS